VAVGSGCADGGATAIGDGIVGLDFWATSGCVAVEAGGAGGGGDVSFCFFVSFLPFGNGVVFASFAFLGGTCVIGGTSTGLAGSIRTNAFCAGGGVPLGGRPMIGT
jgi:hypothetical protein